MRRDSVGRLGILGNDSVWGREIKEGEENILGRTLCQKRRQLQKWKRREVKTSKEVFYGRRKSHRRQERLIELSEV